MDTAFYLFAILVFAVVVLMIEGAYLWWTSTRGAAAKRVEKRLTSMSFDMQQGPDSFSIEKERTLSSVPAVAELLGRIPQIESFDRALQQSGKSWTVGQCVGYTFSAFFVTLFLSSLTTIPSVVRLLIAMLAASVPCSLVLRSRDHRLKKFEEQLPEAADLISRALRAGHAFPSALQMVSTEMPEPIASEFRAAFDEINFGVSMSRALQNMAARVPLMDLRFFVIAVLIQRESGGNSAEILGNISNIIRKRLELLSKVRVLSAEGRLSAIILGALPFAVGSAVMAINPGFLEVLWKDPAGINLIYAALVMMAVGMLWMRKIIRIRV